VIVLSFTIDATVESFSSEEEAAMKDVFASELDCYEPACLLELQAMASSLRIDVTATLLMPSADVSSAMKAQASMMTSLGKEELSSVVGWTVETAATSTVRENVIVSIFKKTPPSLPPLPAAGTADATSQTTSQDAGPVAIGVAVGCGAGVLLLCILTVVFYRYRKACSKSSKDPADKYGSAEAAAEDRDADFTMAPDVAGDQASIESAADDHGELPIVLSADDPSALTIVLSEDVRLDDPTADAGQSHDDVLQPSLALVEAAAAAAASTAQRREKRQQRRMGSPPKRQADSTLENVQRSVAVHRAPPERQTDDTIKDAQRSIATHRQPPRRQIPATLETPPRKLLHRAPPKRQTDDTLEDVQRSVATHRQPPRRQKPVTLEDSELGTVALPQRQSEDTLEHVPRSVATGSEVVDVLSDGPGSYREAPERAAEEPTGNTASDVIGKSLSHREPPKRTTNDKLGDVLEETSTQPEDSMVDDEGAAILRKASARQYRPPPARSVVTPGLPPLGAGAPHFEYRAPPPRANAGEGGSAASTTVPTAIAGVQQPPYRLPPSRSADDLDPELAQARLQDIIDQPPLSEASQRRLRDARRERRAERRLTSSASADAVQQRL